MNIYIDMDGTIADLYGVSNWLEYLENEDITPYKEAKPLVNLSLLARYLNKIQQSGKEIAILSWLSKSGSNEYNEAVAEVKRNWLAKHMPSVRWNEIIIIPYGEPKKNYCRSPLDILFDDELHNRKDWGNDNAYPETAIFDVLKELIGR